MGQIYEQGGSKSRQETTQQPEVATTLPGGTTSGRTAGPMDPMEMYISYMAYSLVENDPLTADIIREMEAKGEVPMASAEAVVSDRLRGLVDMIDATDGVQNGRTSRDAFLQNLDQLIGSVQPFTGNADRHQAMQQNYHAIRERLASQLPETITLPDRATTDRMATDLVRMVNIDSNRAISDAEMLSASGSLRQMVYNFLSVTPADAPDSGLHGAHAQQRSRDVLPGGN